MVIRKLDSALIDKIAAGEVVERPASVVKELLENSIDAGAQRISLHIEDGGLKLIRVVDDGEGIAEDEIPLAFTRHATSKIASIEDLSEISSLGFRGEALPSIASVAKITVFSRTGKSEEGFYAEYSAGERMEGHGRGGPRGTNISVSELFFNVPARRKFLRSSRAEYLEIMEHFYAFALMYPEISFRFFNDGKEKISLLSGELKGRFAAIVKDLSGEDLNEVDLSQEGYSVQGLVSRPSSFRKNKKRIYISMNGRMLKDQKLIYYVSSACESFFMKGTYPLAVINLKIPPEEVDVNVHPRKTEVRFLAPSKIRNLVFKGVAEALGEGAAVYREDMEVKVPSANTPQVEQGSFGFTSADMEMHGNSQAQHSKSSPAGLKLFDEPVQLLGRIDNTYLIIKGENSLMLMDQHAADERVLFERIQREMKGAVKLTQELLVPLELPFVPEKHHIEFLKEAGFEFNSNCSAFTGVPPWLHIRYPKRGASMIMDMLEGENYQFMDWVKDLACKAAVKGGEYLPLELIEEIFQGLSTCKNPFQCPHGRPTMIKYGITDLEKLFKRT